MNLHNAWLVWCTLTLLVVTAGCVRNVPYRLGGTGAPSPEPEAQWERAAPKGSPRQASAVQCQTGASTPAICLDPHTTSTATFDLAFIEFDDQGELWSIGDLNYNHGAPKHTQLQYALDLIRTRKQERQGVRVITFVHGWRNNASAEDENSDKNLKNFKVMLKELAASFTDKPIVGIFVSWRGESIKDDAFFSYWNRRDAAMRVSRSSMTEALFDIMFTAKPPESPSLENDCGAEPKKSDGSQVLLVGHSFGSRVLEHAISQPIMALLLERRSETLACRAEWNDKHDAKSNKPALFESPADLIVLLNAANDAFETKAMIEGMKRMNFRIADPGMQNSHDSSGAVEEVYFDAQQPLVVAILSEGDWPTTKVMPKAQWLSSPTQSLNRKYDDQAIAEGEISSEVDNKAVIVNEKTFYYRNEGSIQALWTHHIKELATYDNELADPSAANKACRRTYAFHFDVEDGKVIHSFVADPESLCNVSLKFRNNTPFWVMQVPKPVIKDHSSIFVSGTEQILTSILTRKMKETPTRMELTPNNPPSSTIHD